MWVFIIKRCKTLIKKIPLINSYINIPNAHQSTELLYPTFFKISGAIYSGVPQIVNVLSKDSNCFAILYK